MRVRRLMLCILLSLALTVTFIPMMSYAEPQYGEHAVTFDGIEEFIDDGDFYFADLEQGGEILCDENYDSNDKCFYAMEQNTFSFRVEEESGWYVSNAQYSIDNGARQDAKYDFGEWYFRMPENEGKYSVVIYLTFAQSKPIQSAEVTIQPPVCGTEVTGNSPVGSDAQSPKPVVSVPDGVNYGITKITDDVYYMIWSTENNSYFEGTMKGDEIYYALGGLVPERGYQFASDCSVKINGATDAVVDVSPGYVYLKMQVKALHKWGDWQTTKPAKCTEKGEKRRTCELCDAVNTEELAATGHTVVTDEAVPATCTKTGKTEGSHCSVCNEVIVAPEDTPMLAHNWKHIVNKAGLLKNGSQYDQCTVCKAITNKKVLAGYAASYVKALKVTNAKKAFTVKWAKQNKANQKKFNGYQIRYSKKSNMSGAKYVTAGKGTNGKKVTNLAKKAKYYVQVRTYTKSGNKTFYSKWSAKKAVKTK